MNDNTNFAKVATNKKRNTKKIIIILISIIISFIIITGCSIFGIIINNITAEPKHYDEFIEMEFSTKLKYNQPIPNVSIDRKLNKIYININGYNNYNNITIHILFFSSTFINYIFGNNYNEKIEEYIYENAYRKIIKINGINYKANTTYTRTYDLTFEDMLKAKYIKAFVYSCDE